MNEAQKVKINRLISLFAIEVGEKYPQFTVNVTERSYDGNQINLRFNEGEHTLNIYIYREDIGRSRNNQALRVTFSSNVVGWKRMGQFNKGFGGKRLRTDIDSPEFDKAKIYKSIDRVIDLYQEEKQEFLDRRKSDSERNDKIKQLAKRLTLETGTDWVPYESKSGTVRQKDTYSLTVSESYHGELYIKLPMVSKELGLKILNLVVAEEEKKKIEKEKKKDIA